VTPPTIDIADPPVSETNPNEPIAIDSELYQDVEAEFRGLFGDEAEVNVRVELYRTAPLMKDGEKISGYLEDLPPGVESYLLYIKARHGGGSYCARKRVHGAIKSNKTIVIPACPQRFPDMEASSPDVADLNDNMEIDGVPIGGSDKSFDRRMERIMIMKAMLERGTESKGPDINGVLLEYFLKAKEGPNAMDQVTQLAGVVGSVKELLPSPDGGGDLKSVITKGIEAFTVAVQASASAARPGNGRAPAGVEAGEAPKQLPNPNQGELLVENMTPKEKSLTAIRIITQNALLVPPQEPDLVVQQVDLSLEFTKEDRAKIVPFRAALRSMAVAEAGALFDNGTLDRVKYEAYLDQVFDLFLDPQREAVEFG